MNRHNKFYAEVAGELEGDDYYGDDDDYNYDEEYEEEGEYDEAAYEATASAAPPEPAHMSESTAQATASAAPAVRVNPYTTISPQVDDDYELLDMLLPQLHALWKASAPTMLPLSEGEAVTALRASNYDVEPAFLQLKEKRDEERSKRGGGVLKVTAAAGPANRASTFPAVESPEPGGEEASDNEGNSASPSASSGRTTTTLRGSKGTSQRRTKQMLEMEPDKEKPDCTFVIAGHVDAGKSTTLGHLLLLLGRVSIQDVERNEKADRTHRKDSFKYAWLLDQCEEERRRGVTIDSGSFCFETEHRRVHILDAPGHKDFVLSMISSATQADAALLVVTAATSEFETGLHHGTKSHLLVLKTLGVGSIVVAVNKMDAVAYSQERYDYVVRELQLLLKQTRIPEEAIIGFCPISGMAGVNITQRGAKETPWYHDLSLIEMIDKCPLESRLLNRPLRLSLQDVQGTTLYAKVESGRLFTGDTVHFVPSEVRVAVKSIQKPTVAGPVLVAFAGEMVEISTNSSVTGLYPGCVGCEPNLLIHSSTDFEAHIQTFRTLTKSILPGASFTIIVHALTVRVHVVALISKMDGKTGNWSKGMVKCVPPAAQAMMLFRAESPVALEPATECRALGRFVLQQDGETVAGGLVTRVVDKP
ncbi:hsp70 subfamily B suppressor 1 [Leishmania infantum JPCM5]|uniref:Elongation_factor_1-alpha_-_putative n=2 Tax=Leishmania infantum TaxID=5671 RepID=A0A6L0Y220_LEIIN|nr:hsp70 subfamily B suppressor 1 [Leishmania infantum JPCM5]CAC9546636.1 elongation_factor_1-alpha_-_putative [Leishmania infantum]CAM72327.1 hsp70 subfamily B suppressor 1 [Leishmania infantum JPCM5]SUZ46246.1 elongation_factor_1-alpha_-_putative [Leishmania infantum]|eukprot:XP_001469224.1 hsp70 subfamily B suppressor 1 [Leishmania infantum JPCM5]